MSYAIQANPCLAWREIIVMAALFAWALSLSGSSHNSSSPPVADTNSR